MPCLVNGSSLLTTAHPGKTSPSLSGNVLNKSRRLPVTHGAMDVVYKYSTLVSTFLAVGRAMQAS